MQKNKGKVLHIDPSRRRTRKAGPPPPSANKRTSGGRKGKRRLFWRETENLQEYKRGMAINRSTTIVAGLFFIFVFIYLVRTLFAFFTTPEIPVEMIRMDSIDISLIVEGIIIRDETVYSASRDGVVHFYVNDYVRVQPGALVSSIQNVQALDSIRQSISHVEEQIFELQNIRGELSAVDPAIQRINGQIRNMVDQRLSRHIQLNTSEAYSLRDSIVQNVNTRNRMIVAENLGAQIRADFNIYHETLMGELGANRTGLYIRHGGIVAPVVDGFETDLTFESMYRLSREQTRQNVDFDQIIPRREVSYGDDVFKIVNSNRWYIAAYIPNKLIEGWSVGDRRSLFLEGRRGSLPVRVHYMNPGFQDSFVIFRATSYMIDFLNTRSIFFRTSDTVQHGFRIANTAIIEYSQLAIPLSLVHEGEQAYVVRVAGDEDLIIPIAVIDKDDYFAFIPKYTEFLAVGNVLREAENPFNTRMISEYRNVQGVFRVNAGIAEFVSIVLPDDAPAGSVYTILNPSLNPRLRLHDHIVSDASLVQEGDIVFSGVR